MQPTAYLLVGMMGSGKTTVGRALAARLGITYVDNDTELLAATGQTAAQLLDAQGPEALHDAEADFVRLLLAMPAPYVAGIPGSAIERPELVAAMREHGRVVWLRATLETLAGRVPHTGRPFVDVDAPGVLARLYEGRAVLYAAAAAIVVDVEGRTPDQVVDAILGARDEQPVA